MKKQDGKVSVERNIIEGDDLSPEQSELWDSLLENVISLVRDTEGDDVELEIEIEHELEAEEEELEDPEPEEKEQNNTLLLPFFIYNYYLIEILST